MKKNECILPKEELKRLDKENKKEGRVRVGFENGLPVYIESNDE